MAQILQFTAPAQINSVKTLADGTVKLDVAVAKELPADEMAVLFEARKLGIGWFVFSPNPIDESSIPKEKAEATFEGKSPSTRMYNTLYVRWRELTNQTKPFDVYYVEQMNYLIDQLKRDLPERP
jgi:hypothetical protein